MKKNKQNRQMVADVAAENEVKNNVQEEVKDVNKIELSDEVLFKLGYRESFQTFPFSEFTEVFYVRGENDLVLHKDHGIYFFNYRTREMGRLGYRELETVGDLRGLNGFLSGKDLDVSPLL